MDDQVTTVIGIAFDRLDAALRIGGARKEHELPVWRSLPAIFPEPPAEGNRVPEQGCLLPGRAAVGAYLDLLDVRLASPRRAVDADLGRRGEQTTGARGGDGRLHLHTANRCQHGDAAGSFPDRVIGGLP